LATCHQDKLANTLPYLISTPAPAAFLVLLRMALKQPFLIADLRLSGVGDRETRFPHDDRRGRAQLRTAADGFADASARQHLRNSAATDETLADNAEAQLERRRDPTQDVV
jgi:hypothetical protein